MAKASKRHGTDWAAAAVVAGLSGLAAAGFNRIRTSDAEEANPPIGDFVEGGGTRLHYLRSGEGSPIVLIHGNAVMLQDWIASGVFEALAIDHDVIAFDRPGFGYSDRPRSTIWTAHAQARAIAESLSALGVTRATVVGHSLGAQVAAALALDYPEIVSRLVLLSGYYFPTARLDFLLNAGPAVPVVGDIMRWTVSPLLGRALLPLAEKQMFAPMSVPAEWHDKFPTEMMVRPSQVRATAADGALALEGARQLEKRYGELRGEVVIMSGRDDRVIGHAGQSERLHSVLPGSELNLAEGHGHMIHYTATPAVVRIITGRETAPRSADR